MAASATVRLIEPPESGFHFKDNNNEATIFQALTAKYGERALGWKNEAYGQEYITEANTCLLIAQYYVYRINRHLDLPLTFHATEFQLRLLASAIWLFRNFWFASSEDASRIRQAFRFDPFEWLKPKHRSLRALGKSNGHWFMDSDVVNAAMKEKDVYQRVHEEMNKKDVKWFYDRFIEIYARGQKKHNDTWQTIMGYTPDARLPGRNDPLSALSWQGYQSFWDMFTLDPNHYPIGLILIQFRKSDFPSHLYETVQITDHQSVRRFKPKTEVAVGQDLLRFVTILKTVVIRLHIHVSGIERISWKDAKTWPALYNTCQAELQRTLNEEQEEKPPPLESDQVKRPLHAPAELAQGPPLPTEFLTPEGNPVSLFHALLSVLPYVDATLDERLIEADNCLRIAQYYIQRITTCKECDKFYIEPADPRQRSIYPDIHVTHIQMIASLIWVFRAFWFSPIRWSDKVMKYYMNPFPNMPTTVLQGKGTTDESRTRPLNWFIAPALAEKPDYTTNEEEGKNHIMVSMNAKDVKWFARQFQDIYVREDEKYESEDPLPAKSWRDMIQVSMDGVQDGFGKTFRFSGPYGQQWYEGYRQDLISRHGFVYYDHIPIGFVVLQMHSDTDPHVRLIRRDPGDGRYRILHSDHAYFGTGLFRPPNNDVGPVPMALLEDILREIRGNETKPWTAIIREWERRMGRTLYPHHQEEEPLLLIDDEPPVIPDDKEVKPVPVSPPSEPEEEEEEEESDEDEEGDEDPNDPTLLLSDADIVTQLNNTIADIENRRARLEEPEPVLLFRKLALLIMNQHGATFIAIPDEDKMDINDTARCLAVSVHRFSTQSVGLIDALTGEDIRYWNAVVFYFKNLLLLWEVHFRAVLVRCGLKTHEIQMPIANIVESLRELARDAPDLSSWVSRGWLRKCPLDGLADAPFEQDLIGWDGRLWGPLDTTGMDLAIVLANILKLSDGDNRMLCGIQTLYGPFMHWLDYSRPLGDTLILFKAFPRNEENMDNGILCELLSIDRATAINDARPFLEHAVNTIRESLEDLLLVPRGTLFSDDTSINALANDRFQQIVTLGRNEEERKIPCLVDPAGHTATLRHHIYRCLADIYHAMEIRTKYYLYLREKLPVVVVDNTLRGPMLQMHAVVTAVDTRLANKEWSKRLDSPHAAVAALQTWLDNVLNDESNPGWQRFALALPRLPSIPLWHQANLITPADQRTFLEHVTAWTKAIGYLHEIIMNARGGPLPEHIHHIRDSFVVNKCNDALYVPLVAGMDGLKHALVEDKDRLLWNTYIQRLVHLAEMHRDILEALNISVLHSGFDWEKSVLVHLRRIATGSGASSSPSAEDLAQRQEEEDKRFEAEQKRKEEKEEEEEKKRARRQEEEEEKKRAEARRKEEEKEEELRQEAERFAQQQKRRAEAKQEEERDRLRRERQRQQEEEKKRRQRKELEAEAERKRLEYEQRERDRREESERRRKEQDEKERRDAASKAESERQRLERERLEREQRERERLERERLERERLEREQRERERLEREQRERDEQARLERERLEREALHEAEARLIRERKEAEEKQAAEDAERKRTEQLQRQLALEQEQEQRRLQAEMEKLEREHQAILEKKQQEERDREERDRREREKKEVDAKRKTGVVDRRKGIRFLHALPMRVMLANDSVLAPKAEFTLQEWATHLHILVKSRMHIMEWIGHWKTNKEWDYECKNQSLYLSLDKQVHLIWAKSDPLSRMFVPPDMVKHMYVQALDYTGQLVYHVWTRFAKTEIARGLDEQSKRPDADSPYHIYDAHNGLDATDMTRLLYLLFLFFHPVVALPPTADTSADLTRSVREVNRSYAQSFTHKPIRHFLLRALRQRGLALVSATGPLTDARMDYSGFVGTDRVETEVGKRHNRELWNKTLHDKHNWGLRDMLLILFVSLLYRQRDIGKCLYAFLTHADSGVGWSREVVQNAWIQTMYHQCLLYDTKTQ